MAQLNSTTSIQRTSSRMSNPKVFLVVLCASCLWLCQAAPSDIQPANQAALGNQPVNPSEKQQQPPAPEIQAVNSKQEQQASPVGSAPMKLPNINIYINRNEIKKLLGIDSRINYVTNGNIDTYPFGFTIPLGYNQTDMIFTWQNLGQTNVNYSISLVIGNIHAVEAPLINITRSGLIPMHEQVFKITLPCSGKMSVEVDFQVLINITGFVSADEDFATPTALGDEQQLVGEEAQTGSQMQSDQAAAEAAKMRLVSHKLVLNRKKICTVHPVPVPVQPPARIASTGANQGRPPAQLPAIPNSNPVPAPAPPTSGGGGGGGPGWPTHNAPTVISKEANSRPISEAPTSVDQQASSVVDYEPAARNPFPASLDSGEFLDESTKMMTSLFNFIPPTPPAPGRRLGHQAAPTIGDLAQQPIGAYANWPARSNKIPKLAPSVLTGNDIDVSGRSLNSYQQQQQQQQVAANNNPLVFTLIGLSLLISVALIVVAILGSSSSSSPSRLKRSPLDNLSSFTRGILRRNFESAASQMVASKCPESANTGPVISSLRAGPKSSQASSMSGLSAISGGPFANNKSSACYKTSCAANGYYTTSGASQHQYHYSTGTHHYQHPPTADLLGTGYQCQQQQQVPVVPQYPIHHIAPGNLNQTTRLIWNNGNGNSPDGFTVDGSYMPLSIGARSETGSLYQTIH